MFKAIISDFDNTLVGHDLVLDQAVVDAVIKFQEKGFLFSLATGRGYFGDLAAAVKRMQLKAPVIIRNGAEIIDPANHLVIYGKYIKAEVVSSIVQSLIKSGHEFYVEQGDFTFSPGAIPGIHAPNEQYQDIIELVPENVPKILIKTTDNTEAQRLVDQFVMEFGEAIATKINQVQENNFAVDINSAEVSKSSAVKFLIEYLDLKKEEIVAVGDNTNDLPLFAECGYKVAVGNALELLKTHADYVTLSEAENGIVPLIEKMLRGEL